MNAMVRVHRITHEHALYPQECDLRSRVLLENVGMTMDDYRRFAPGAEEAAEHFIAVIDLPGDPGSSNPGDPVQRVVGCALLMPSNPGPGSGKLVQMAVDPQRQGEGIGRKLVAALERRALAPEEAGGLGYTELYCHARDHAIGFYASLGWEPRGERFDEVGIEHQKLVLAAHPAPSA